MSFNVDRTIDTNPPAVLALIDKIENDERLRNILAAAADSNAKLLDALKNKLMEPDQDQSKLVMPRQRRKNLNGWEAGAILEVEQNSRQKKLVRTIVEQVQTYQDIRDDVLKNSANAAASGVGEHMNRIYVGSLDFSIGESYVEQLFGAFGRVVNVSMPRDPSNPNVSRGYCFVEYDNRESADRAMASMHGHVISGRPIKVSLPSVGGGAPGAPAGQASDSIGPNPASRLFFANIPLDLQENHVRPVFDAFGALRGLQLVRAPGAATHKGCGFVEFYDEDGAEAALASLQGFTVGGRLVDVKRVQPRDGHPDGGDPALVNPAQLQQARLAAQQGLQMASAVAATTGPVMATGDSGRLGDVQVASQSERVELSRRLEASRNPDARTLVLQHMLSPQDLREATEAELKDEIAEECRKYGLIHEIQIHGSANGPADADIKVFVRYSDSMGALKARDVLNGRFFAQRRISADIITEIPPWRQ